MVKTRKMGRRRRCDRGGDWKRRVEAPFKWSWRHALIPNYLTGKFTKKGPNLKESVNEVFTWKGIYNKGAKGSKGTKGAKGGGGAGERGGVHGDVGNVTASAVRAASFAETIAVAGGGALCAAGYLVRRRC